ncbi:hypothetical protein ACEUAM_22550 [Aeromonas hydrophila]|uniref:F4 family fimbrial subunit n=1 Tax=Aeromonas hydrophila TaxID=644 RepID=UPI0038D14546
MKNNTLSIMLAALFAGASASAMAWTINGSGATVDFSGTLSQRVTNTPWEVKMGAPIVLNGEIAPGSRTATLTVTKPVLMIGIRSDKTKYDDAQGFKGRPGIIPQIDFGGKLDVDSFVGSVAKLTLDVMDESNTIQIGKMTASVLSAGESTTNVDGDINRNALIAKSVGDGFWGAVPKQAEKTIILPRIRMTAIDNELTSTAPSGGGQGTPSVEKFDNPALRYSAFYGAGLEMGSEVLLSLNTTPVADLKWKSSLPVTISYM